MPMLLLVRQILAVDANDFATLVAIVGKDFLVTFDAEGMVFPQHISDSNVILVMP